MAGGARERSRASRRCSPPLLREASPTELAGTGLTLAWPQSAGLSKRPAEDPAKRELIARSIRAVTGASLRLAYELRADAELAPAVEQAQLTEEELVGSLQARVQRGRRAAAQRGGA